jgi:hypothetical protein
MCTLSWRSRPRHRPSGFTAAWGHGRRRRCAPASSPCISFQHSSARAQTQDTVNKSKTRSHQIWSHHIRHAMRILSAYPNFLYTAVSCILCCASPLARRAHCPPLRARIGRNARDLRPRATQHTARDLQTLSRSCRQRKRHRLPHAEHEHKRSLLSCERLRDDGSAALRRRWHVGCAVAESCRACRRRVVRETWRCVPLGVGEWFQSDCNTKHDPNRHTLTQDGVGLNKWWARRASERARFFLEARGLRSFSSSKSKSTFCCFNARATAASCAVEKAFVVWPFFGV